MIVDTSGLDRLMARLRKIAEPNATPLMAHWMNVIEEDNRKGVLAGTDKDGFPMIPVTYRPVRPIMQLTAAHRAGRRKNAKRGEFNPGREANLTREQYEALDGPPLAPRRQFSRVITNLVLAFAPNPAILKQGQTVEAFGAWDDVVSKRGYPFLPVHFEGRRAGRGRGFKMPKRDLRGVRPAGVQKALSALRAWAISIVREQG